MVFTSAITATKRFQFDKTSGSLEYSQRYNCGPTCVSMVAGFYNDNTPGIEATRRLAAAPGRPTTYYEQRDMLIRRGVPATFIQLSTLQQIRNIVGSGRRPIVIGVEMWKVPWYVRDHPFLGWHAVVILGVASGGFWVNDPNFSPAGGSRPDPDRGKKFWPDWVMQAAFINANNSPAIVPLAAKTIYVPPPPPPPAPKDDVVDGDPGIMRYRSTVNQSTGAVTLLRIKGSKPYRRGVTTSKPAKYSPPAGEPIVAIGYIPKEDVEAKFPGQLKYGDVWLVPSYQTNGDHIFYVKDVDVTRR